jgi:hypothetical protein
MPVIDDATRLQHILEAAEKAVKYTKNRKRADLDNDELLGLGLIRLLEIIGEAAWGISDVLRRKYPQMLGVRWPVCATASFTVILMSITTSSGKPSPLNSRPSSPKSKPSLKKNPNNNHHLSF